jgi:hypothetical protein
MRLQAALPDRFQPVYRTLKYVKAECRSLAAQLAAVAESSP